ncbi:MAG TPA: hypothetical protein VJS92_04270 [Candidatus Polarisedimenticolaceae bacterium]|nr:hypothetical protein [Candidatus Polarisedimenticolaceae bacterium]
MTRKMRRDVASGSLLIAGALAGVVVMAFHPSGLGPLGTEAGQRIARTNVLVHGLALVAVPVTFLGLLGVARRLGPTGLTSAALVAFGYGSAAVMSAAIASGFVATDTAAQIVAAEGSRVPQAFLVYTHAWNQGYARVYAAAFAAGTLLFSAAMLRGPARMGAAAIAGLVIGAFLLLGVLSGYLTMSLHGFALLTLLQSSWFVGLGGWLCRESAA